MPLLPDLTTLANKARHMEMYCDDPYHHHRSPIQQLFGLEYRGHHVSVTIDGGEYSVQIDYDTLTTRTGLTWNEVEKYVERMTR